jgi:hypothetical protein
MNKFEIIKFTLSVGMVVHGGLSSLAVDGHSSGNGDYSFEKSMEILETAKINLLHLLPHLLKHNLSDELTPERMQKISQLVSALPTAEDKVCNIKAKDPVTDRDLMFDHFPRPEKNETGPARIFATRDFCFAYMEEDLETRDLAVPGIMRRMLLESSHTLGFDQKKGRAFAEKLIPKVDQRTLLTLEDKPLRIAAVLISRLENAALARVQAAENEKARLQRVAVLNAAAKKMEVRIDQLVIYLKDEVPKLKAAYDEAMKQQDRFIKAGATQAEQHRRALSSTDTHTAPVQQKIDEDLKFLIDQSLILMGQSQDEKTIDDFQGVNRKFIRMLSETSFLHVFSNYESWKTEIKNLENVKTQLSEILSNVSG